MQIDNKVPCSSWNAQTMIDHCVGEHPRWKSHQILLHPVYQPASDTHPCQLSCSLLDPRWESSIDAVNLGSWRGGGVLNVLVPAHSLVSSASLHHIRDGSHCIELCLLTETWLHGPYPASPIFWFFIVNIVNSSSCIITNFIVLLLFPMMWNYLWFLSDSQNRFP